MREYHSCKLDKMYMFLCASTYIYHHHPPPPPPPHPGCQCSLVSITTNKMLDTFSQESKVRDARNIHNCCPEHHQQVTQLHTTDSWHSTPNQPWRSYLAGTESLNHKQTHETVHVIHHSKVGKWLEEERKKERKKERKSNYTGKSGRIPGSRSSTQLWQSECNAAPDLKEGTLWY